MVNPWIIAVAVTIATFMEVLDTSIANVALRYIAGGLSAAESDSEWIITSYLAANASVLLLSGWLSSYFGRRNYYLASLLIFTVSSAACGFARSLPELIFFRILQGLGGGGLQPVTQAVLVDTFPAEKQGRRRRCSASRPWWRRCSARRSAATSPTTIRGSGSSSSTSRPACWPWPSTTPCSATRTTSRPSAPRCGASRCGSTPSAWG